MTDHPITPPPLNTVKEWLLSNGCGGLSVLEASAIATQAARWGADQELEACCEWLRSDGLFETRPGHLRAARRPKPPSLKEQALAELEILSDYAHGLGCSESAIRRALEALSE